MTSLGVDNLTTTGCFRDVGAPVPTIAKMCHKLDIDQQDIPTIWAVLVNAEGKDWNGRKGRSALISKVVVEVV
jgi:hypothetical protein